MLLQFHVSNFLSFKDEVSVNMIPAKSQRLNDHILHDDEGKKTSALPLGVIYGANASGKSNLVEAISFARDLVVAGRDPDQGMEIVSFKLDRNCISRPSKFDFVFKKKGIVYSYGFVLDENTVKEEWLFAYYTKRESKVFERITKNGRTHVEAGNRLVADVEKAGMINFIAQGTRPNQLFLHEAVDRNVELLKLPFAWFKNNLIIINAYAEYRFLTHRAHKDNKFHEFLSKIVRIADTGIHEIDCKKEEFDIEKQLRGIPKEYLSDLLSDLKKRDSVETVISPFGIKTFVHNPDDPEKPFYLALQTKHKDNQGEDVFFDLREESDGTRRLMHLAPMLVNEWGRECVYVIDELERSLHTNLTRLIFQIFLEGVRSENSSNQLVVTTHDTNLLDKELLRRDEILFMEKDETGASHLTSLAEYLVNKGLNYEKGYLNGRFGAVPFLGNISHLFEESK